MKIQVRSERVSDYNSIANVNYQAFHNWHPDNPFVCEPLLVDLIRHSSLFDPELSLVLERDNEVVGHALFTPFQFIVLGREERGVLLGPIAIAPCMQRQGLGRLLMEEGHKRVAAKGFSFSLLCGHETYYPKFGYKTRMFSLSGSTVLIVKERPKEDLWERPVKKEDIPWILEAWKKGHSKDCLALLPGATLSDWCNHGVLHRSSVIGYQKSIVGYVRYGTHPLSLKEVLAEKEDLPRILHYLGAGKKELTIGLPADLLLEILDPNYFQVLDTQEAQDAFMIRVFQLESRIFEYTKQVEEGLRKPGIIIFPAVFDIDSNTLED